MFPHLNRSSEWIHGAPSGTSEPLEKVKVGVVEGDLMSLRR